MSKRTIAVPIAIVVVGAALYFSAQYAVETFISDAATRLAYQIRNEAAVLERSGERVRTFTHQPRTWPEGISGDFVDVPEDLAVSHRTGEATRVTMHVENGRILVSALE